MDLDIEMDDAVEVAHPPEAYTTDIIFSEEEQEPGEVEESQPEDTRPDERTIVPYKIHIRGLDTFNPADVKAYVAEHFGSGQFDRVEWIDDVSANLIFRSDSTAQEALLALASVEIADATQLPPLESLPAKAFSGKPGSTLHVRFAVATDKKAEGAAARSRFYLLHPEYDPEERRRRGEFDRGKYRDRGDRGRGQDRRSGRRRDDRFDDESEPFDVSLYDDDEAALAKRANIKPRARDARDSKSSEEDDNYARRNRDKELFPSRRPRVGGGISARDRSASPIRDDARMELDDLAKDREAAARNRDKARAIKGRLSKDIGAKELFPDKLSSSAPGSKAQMDQVDEGTVLSSAKLADRITPRATTATATTTADTSSAFNIRGMANKRGADQGFAIKGTGASAKELFPEKLGNASKELFADKVERRGRRRQKAEDLFF